VSDVLGRDLLGASGARLLRWSCRRRAEAGFDDAFIYEELRRPPESRRIPMTQLMSEEALAILRLGSGSRTRLPTDFV